MSKTTVNNSMGSATVQPNADGSLRLGIDSHTDGPALIDLTRESAAIIGRALTNTPAPHLANARFEDVQVGDMVRATYADGDCTTILEGVIATLGGGTQNWHCTKSGRGIASRNLYPGENRAITILSRPTPQLPTEPGAVILVELPYGTVAATRTTQKSWRFYDRDGDSRLNDDDTISRQPWKLAKVVEA